MKLEDYPAQSEANMRIYPSDIKEKRFPRKFRGYDVEEVYAFLEVVREEMENLVRENASLNRRLYISEHQGEDTETTQEMVTAYIDKVSEVTELLLKRLGVAA